MSQRNSHVQHSSIERLEPRFLMSFAAMEPITGSVTGSVFNDLNGDGLRQAGEQGIPGIRVYVDLNGNRSYDAGEPSVFTDAAGNYTISGLNAGGYVVREVLPAGKLQTTPALGYGVWAPLGAGQTLSLQPFGQAAAPETVSGTVFNDSNHDGVQDNGETGLAGVPVYIDPNYNRKLDAGEQSVVTDALGRYTLSNLPADPEIVRVVLPSGTQQTYPAGGIGQYIGRNTGQTLTGVDFGIYTPVQTGTINGTVFAEPVTGQIEGGVGGATVYVDLKNAGSFAAGDPSALTDPFGDYTISNVPPGTYSVRLIVPPGSGDVQDMPPGNSGNLITLAAGQTLNGVNFSVITSKFPLTQDISGTVFNDVNRDGIQEVTEKGLVGVRVYADLNGNRSYDPGEPFATTDSVGNYTITGLDAGNYVVREVLSPGTIQTTPTNGHGVWAPLASGQSLSLQPFGQATAPAAISGHIFNDVNGNGQQESNESGLPGIQVYADLNGNRHYDSGEPSARTDSHGNYTIPNLTGGAGYVIRETVSSGYAQTTPASNYGIWAVPGAGQILLVQPFGQKLSRGSLDPSYGVNGLARTSVTDTVTGLAIDRLGNAIVAIADGTVLRYLPNGAPDASFGTGGATRVNFGSGYGGDIESAAVQADGRILLSGYVFTQGDNETFSALLVRLMSSGLPDTTFGAGGELITRVAGIWDARAIASLPSGKILLAATAGAGDGSIKVVRLSADGSLDSTFGNGGIGSSADFLGRNGGANSLLVEPNGQILVGGIWTGQPYASGTEIARFNADGSPDITFGADNGPAAANLAVQADGKILAGESGIINRYTSNGVLDTTFGVQGALSTGLAMGGGAHAELLAVQSDGKLLVAGTDKGSLVLALYTPTGTPDTAFGTNGRVTLTPGVASTFTAGGLALDALGRALVVGTLTSTTNFLPFQIALERIVTA